MRTEETIITVLVILLIFAAILYGPVLLNLERAKERYGVPPGMVRSVSEEYLPLDRGWAREHYDLLRREYEANTASSISHVVDRSA